MQDLEHFIFKMKMQSCNSRCQLCTSNTDNLAVPSALLAAWTLFNSLSLNNSRQDHQQQIKIRRGP